MTARVVGVRIMTADDVCGYVVKALLDEIALVDVQNWVINQNLDVIWKSYLRGFKGNEAKLIIAIDDEEFIFAEYNLNNGKPCYVKQLNDEELCKFFATGKSTNAPMEDSTWIEKTNFSYGFSYETVFGNLKVGKDDDDDRVYVAVSMIPLDRNARVCMFKGQLLKKEILNMLDSRCLDGLSMAMSTDARLGLVDDVVIQIKGDESQSFKPYAPIPYEHLRSFVERVLPDDDDDKPKRKKGLLDVIKGFCD